MSTTAPSAYPIRRRPRLCKTCLPCRASKVRCDRNLPCGNCAKRNFTCSYSQAPLSTGATIPHLPPQSQSQSQQPPSTLPPSLQQHIIQREICPRNNPYPSVTVTPSDTSIPSARFTPDQSRFQYAAGNYGAGMDCDGVVGDDEGDDDDEDEDDPSDTVNISQAEWEDIHTKMGAMEQILNSLHLLFQSHSGRRCKGPEPPPPPPSTSSPSTSSIKESPPAKTETDRERRHSPQVGNIFRPSPLLKKGTIHIGPRSALVDIFNKSKTSDDTARALPKDDLLAELALGNQSVAYPFVDLWSSDPFTFNIVAVCDVLPVDMQCHRFFDYYKNIGAVLYPVLSDIAQVEQSVQQLLRNRAAAGGGYHPDDNGLVKPFGMSLGFLSLLFAILASGCQLSDLSASERELTSWVYVSCSYQCLRMMNYVAQPTVEVIQILLIISNVLSYNMNAGASYTLLGMTERMCMVLGLHVETPGFSRSEQAVRRKTWWTMAFQNSHFSLAYDRPSITMISQPEIPYDRKSMPGHRSYFESLCRVVSLALEVLRRRLDLEHSHVRYHDIREYKQRMHRILAEAAPHLRFADRCATIADNIERTELRLHSCYLISVLCRVSLDPDSHLDGYRRALVREDCIANLIGTIEAFVELHSINHHCSRSWISVQRAIACAFLLVAHDGQSHPQTRFLIQKLQDVLADHVYADGAVAHNSRTDSAKHLATSLRALREISAAFQARQMRTPPDSGVVSKSDTPNITVTVPATSGSMMVNPGMAEPAMPGYGQGQSYVPMEYEYPDMRNILDQVSDVMLFPSMSE